MAKRPRLTEDQQKFVAKRGVDVLWWDAASPIEDGWKGGDTENKTDAVVQLCRTLGFVIRSDSKQVVVGGTTSEDDGWCGETAIPRGCIIRMRKI